MSTNRFREIFSNLHISDNACLNDDRYYKVCSLFEILNQNVKQLFSTTCRSIDESMIPYYGKHGTEQFMLIRFVLSSGVLHLLMDTCFMQNHTVVLALS